MSLPKKKADEIEHDASDTQRDDYNCEIPCDLFKTNYKHMKTTNNHSSRIFEGAGYLLGSLITIVLGIGLFFLTENFVIALSSSLPVGTVMGILIEQKFQNEESQQLKQKTKLFAGLLLLGIIVFFAILFL